MREEDAGIVISSTRLLLVLFEQRGALGKRLHCERWSQEVVCWDLDEIQVYTYRIIVITAVALEICKL